MDFLKEIQTEITPSVVKSPFWWKTYGGYTSEQSAFAAKQLDPISGRRIHDPMSGQAFSLCQMAWHGGKVYLSDINPGPLSLASLRDPQLLKVATKIGGDLANLLIRTGKRRKSMKHPEYCREWLSNKTRIGLKEMFEMLGLDQTISPFDVGTGFWKLESSKKLPVAIAVLAARSLSCFRATDNQTWLRKGGVTPELTVDEAMRQALSSWMSFASNACRQADMRGRLGITTWNIDKGPVPGLRAMDAIVVSPPYANRLDYSSLWAPETAILSAIFDKAADYLKTEQVGSTVVKNRWPNAEAIRELPSAIYKVLNAIRSHAAHASDSYYYPFFANYALSLKRAVENWSGLLKKGGKLVVFVRDTVRKDHLFPTDRLISEVAEKSGLVPLEGGTRLEIIRTHVGFLRKIVLARVFTASPNGNGGLCFKRIDNENSYFTSGTPPARAVWGDGLRSRAQRPVLSG